MSHFCFNGARQEAAWSLWIRTHSDSPCIHVKAGIIKARWFSSSDFHSTFLFFRFHWKFLDNQIFSKQTCRFKSDFASWQLNLPPKLQLPPCTDGVFCLLFTLSVQTRYRKYDNKRITNLIIFHWLWLLGSWHPTVIVFSRKLTLLMLSKFIVTAGD